MGRRARLAGLDRAGSDAELEMASCAAAATRQPQMSPRFPQQYRGITLGELRDFYHQHREFIEETVWRCSTCASTPWAFKFSGGPAALQQKWYDAGTHAGRRQYFNFQGGTIKWGTCSGKAAWVLCLSSVPTYYNTDDGTHPPKIGWTSAVEPHPGHITMKDMMFEVLRGAEYCPRCYGRKGKWETKNMHEVVNCLVRHQCEPLQVSYAELLAQRTPGRGGTARTISSGYARSAQPGTGVKAQTFVSHWWGEEFGKFLKSLERYAQYRVCVARGIGRTAKLAVLVQLILVTTVAVAVRQPTVRSYLESPLAWQAGTFLLGAFCEAVFVAVLFFKRRRGFYGLHEWSFWICAFANDQFEVDGAFGEHDDVMKSAFVDALRSDSVDSAIAVLDGDGGIGRRVWCAFEIFWAGANLNNKLRVDTVSATGLLGQGDSNEGCRATMVDLIDTLDTESAKCTYDSDKGAIEQAMRSEGIWYRDLDEALTGMLTHSMAAWKGRRRVPWVLMAITPIASACLTASYRKWMMKILPPSRVPSALQADAGLVPIGAHDLSLAFAFFWCLLYISIFGEFDEKRCLVTFWNSGTAQQKHLLRRANYILFVLCTPSVVVFWLAVLIRSMPEFFGKMFILMRIGEGVLAACGVAFGLAYAVIKENPRRLSDHSRQLVENMLLY